MRSPAADGVAPGGAAPELLVHADLAAASRAAVERVVDAAARAVAARGRFTIALAGGSTPRMLYALLATTERARVPWARTWVCFGDERCVPPTDPASNYRTAREALLAHVPVPEAQVLRMPGELEPAAGARRYERELRAALGDDAALDLVLLGVGADGHTASLFPGSPVLEERERRVCAAEAPPPVVPRHRLTLTLPVLCGAREALFLVAGADKRAAVRAALSPEGASLPAARVRAREATLWMVDRAAR